MVGLLFFDLTATGSYTDISTADPTKGYDHPEIVAFLKHDPDLFRIDTRTDIKDLWQPDTAALYGLQDVGGVANPLALRQWTQLWEATGGRQSRLYDMLNVKYVLVHKGTPLPAGKFDLVLNAPDELSVYRNRDFMPRAWLVHKAQVVSGVQAALDVLREPGFDPLQSVVLSAPPTRQPTVAGAFQISDIAEKVTFDHYSSSDLSLAVNAAEPGYVVLSEAWYPGWQATVNGAPVAVFRANGALRAIPVPAGKSNIRLHFAPSGWAWDWLAVGLGVIFFAATFLLDRPQLGRRL